MGEDEKIEKTEDGGVLSLEPYRFDLCDPDALLAMAGIMYEGKRKGRGEEWRKIPASRHLDHAVIHIFRHLAGQRDEDHLGRAMCRTMMAWAVHYKGGRK